jgi:hypothetical protein
MTHGHAVTATSNEARITLTYIRDVPVILYAPPPTQGPKGATHVSITEFRWTWQPLALMHRALPLTSRAHPPACGSTPIWLGRATRFAWVVS